jgi:polyhydroxyalkanoate synthesis regulator phasin
MELDEETRAQLAEIKAQVEAGEITREEAKEMLEEMGIKPMGKGRHFGKHGSKDNLNEVSESAEATDDSL